MVSGTTAMLAPSAERILAALLAFEALRAVDEERDDRQRVDDGQQGHEWLDVHSMNRSARGHARGATLGPHISARR
jgi:hypothetical protein